MVVGEQGWKSSRLRLYAHNSIRAGPVSEITTIWSTSGTVEPLILNDNHNQTDTVWARKWKKRSTGGYEVNGTVAELTEKHREEVKQHKTSYVQRPRWPIVGLSQTTEANQEFGPVPTERRLVDAVSVEDGCGWLRTVDDGIVVGGWGRLGTVEDGSTWRQGGAAGNKFGWF